MEKELILKIIQKALETNSRQKNTVFINYYGHVNSISIQIHTNGWKENEHPDYSKNIYLDNRPYKQSKEELQEILDKLDKIKELSITNQSHDSSNNRVQTIK